MRIFENVNYISVYTTEIEKKWKIKKNHCEYKFHPMDRVVPSPLSLHLEGSLLFDSLLVSFSPTVVLDAWLFLRVHNLNPTWLYQKYSKNIWECKLYSNIYHRNWKEEKKWRKKIIANINYIPVYITEIPRNE